MKRLIFPLFILMLAPCKILAQTELPRECNVFYPEVLLNSTVLEKTDADALARSKDFGQAKKPRVVKHWIVFSDRDDNITFSSPSSSASQYSSLNLNDEVRIAKIQNGFALVYKEPQRDIQYPMLSQFAESKGWIKMDHLLLWHSCPANDAGIYNKALLCVNLDGEKVKNVKSGRLYKNPSNDKKYNTLVTDMNFYFVMKQEGKMALLATQHTLEGTTNRVLHGWVEESSYVAWNQRSCLEPTWKISDVNYFADKKMKAQIYGDMSAKGDPVSFIPFVREKENGDKYQYRMAPNALRFPILDNGTQTLYNCSTFGATGDAQGTDMTQYFEEEDERTRKGGEAMKQLSQIRVAIVIDGTKSMEPYFPAVRKAIQQSFTGQTNNIKVGVVIYRDYSDGEYVTEMLPFTDPKNPELQKFLDSGGKYGVKSSSKDHTFAEAVYYGINTALDKLNFNPDQSNLMFVVGDCGNDREDHKVSENDIIDKLVAKQIHFMGFQVRNNEDDAFGIFNTQILNIMKNSVQKKYNKLGAVKVNAVRDAGGYTIKNDQQNGLYIGSHRYTKQGSAMKAEELTNLVIKAINDCRGVSEEQIAQVSTAVTNREFGKTTAVNGQLSINEVFVRQRLGITDENEDTSGKLLSFKGWTPKQVDHRDVYKPVIFISSDEFTTLLSRLEPINEVAQTESNDREPYINALKALIRSLVPDITDAEMNRKGYAEVMRMIAGLNEASSSLKGPSITDIASKEVVSQSEYISLINDFKSKYDKLQRIKRSQYKYVRQFGGTKYYWVPIEDLP